MRIRAGAALALALAQALPVLAGPSLSRVERGRVTTMLRRVRTDVLARYYDPAFRGIPLAARFEAAERALEQAQSLSQAMTVVASVLDELGDAHTFFIPPPYATRTDYGWTFQAVGESCFVSAVRPKSDAEAKGVQPGDRLLAVDGLPLTPANQYAFRYLYYVLQPRTRVHLSVQSPGGQPRSLQIESRVRQRRLVVTLDDDGDLWDLIRESESEARKLAHRYVDEERVFVWKMPAFDLDREDVYALLDKARKRPALVLDLRGNGGGAVKTLELLAGGLFGRPVTLCRFKSREGEEPCLGRLRPGKSFDGKLVVLVDRDSASSAEILARVVQLEKRGRVVGDRTNGLVMRARRLRYEMGGDTTVFYGLSVTDADVLTGQGERLEDVGVTPDEQVRPSADDLRAGRDPVLAAALTQLGLETTPAEAGRLFPVEWE